jgi:hypothetical protein
MFILSNEKVPSTEKELERMTDELKFLIIAGSDAPSQVMASDPAIIRNFSSSVMRSSSFSVLGTFSLERIVDHAKNSKPS